LIKLTEKQKERVLEAACEICKYPSFLTQEQLDAVCVVCPVEYAVSLIREEKEATENG
jgi:uncharacterized Zn finger protein (UPF0148 family)